VLYDDDEVLAVVRCPFIRRRHRLANARSLQPSAQLFLEKGVDNVAVLTGGLREFLAVAGSELCEGTPPPELVRSRAALPRLSLASTLALARASRPSSAVAHGRLSSGSGAASRAADSPRWR
jgi:hypothetical protein